MRIQNQLSGSKELLECPKRRAGALEILYTYCLDGGVRQDLED